MELTDAFDIINKSKFDVELRGTDEYIEAQLLDEGFRHIIYEVGPYCQLSCSHCYSDCGPSNSKKPNDKLDDRIIKVALDNEIDVIHLTDGEPFSEKNVGLMKKIAQISKDISIEVITNSCFAYDINNLEFWTDLLVENGWSFSQVESKTIPNLKRTPWIDLSQGQYYPLKTREVIPLIYRTFVDNFEMSSIRDSLVLRLVSSTLMEDQKSNIFDIIETLDEGLGLEDVDFSKVNNDLIYFDTNIGKIKMKLQTVGPVKKGIDVLDSVNQEEYILTPENMGAMPYPE